jgi:predicted nucleic acid-binding protein
MKMSKAQDITAYGFTNADKLFFDTNIWLFIYGRQGSPTDSRPSIYSNALKNALRANSQILVDVLVISEFVNRFAHMEYDIQYPNKTQRPKFKQYRDSADFKPVAEAIVSDLRKILKFAARTESGLTTVDIHALLAEFETGGHDFNDQILVGLCVSQTLKLVTDDYDFKGKGVDILTANRRILI